MEVFRGGNEVDLISVQVGSRAGNKMIVVIKAWRP